MSVTGVHFFYLPLHLKPTLKWTFSLTTEPSSNLMVGPQICRETATAHMDAVSLFCQRCQTELTLTIKCLFSFSPAASVRVSLLHVYGEKSVLICLQCVWHLASSRETGRNSNDTRSWNKMTKATLHSTSLEQVIPDSTRKMAREEPAIPLGGCVRVPLTSARLMIHSWRAH